MTVLRCVAFVSVSSDEQAEEGKTSLLEQEQWTRHFIERTIPARYGVQAIHADTLRIVGSRKIILFQDAIATHEAYARLHQLIVEQAFDVLVAMKMNRVAREESLAITIRDLCLAHGIAPCWGDGLPPTLNINELRRDEGWRISGMVQAWGSGREVRELGDKVRAGRKGRVIEKRKFIGAPPYGYLSVRQDKETVAVLHPEQAPVVRTIFIDWYLGRGWGAKSIADQLNRRAIPAPSGKGWTISGVQTLLQRARIYTGAIAYGRFVDGQPEQWLEGQHPAILTPEEYARIEKEQINRHPGAPRRYPFSGFVYCASCDRKMQMNRRRRTLADGTPAEDRYLRCRSCNRTVTEARIKETLELFFDAIEQDDIDIPTGPDTRAAQLDSRIADMERQIATTDSAIDKLVAAYETGAVPLEVLSERVKTRRQQASQLEADLSAARTARRQLDSAGTPQERIDTIRTHARALYESADTHPERTRHFLTQFVRIDVHSPRDLTITPVLYG